MANEQKIIKNKLGVLRLAEMLGNVSMTYSSAWRQHKLRNQLTNSRPPSNMEKLFTRLT